MKNKYVIEVDTYDNEHFIDLLINDSPWISFETYPIRYSHFESKNKIKQILFENKIKEEDLLKMVDNYYRNWIVKYNELHSKIEVNEEGGVIN